MGGHGGLNILPHKTWNGASVWAQSAVGEGWGRHTEQPPQTHPPPHLPTVYGRDQRARVDRDEAAAAAAAETEARRAATATAEARRGALLARAAVRGGASAPPPLTSGGVEALFGRDAPVAGDAVHPEARAEEVAAAVTHGDAAKRTTDARLDASFALGGGARTQQSMPWYARAPSAEPEQVEAPRRERRQRSRSPRTRSTRHRSRSPRHRRHRSRRRSRSPTLAALRAEREAREAAEAERAAAVVSGGGGRGGRRYWSAYGNARQ